MSSRPSIWRWSSLFGKSRGAVVLLPVLLAASSLAQTVKTIRLPEDNALGRLKPAPGVEVVRQNCTACHSTDYIVLQPRTDAQHWEGEVQKMIKVYGAPISDTDARSISDYLGRAYGSEAGGGKQAPARPKR
jgi:hypothetical protein